MGGSEQCPVPSPPWMTKDACNPIHRHGELSFPTVEEFHYFFSTFFLFSVSFSSFTPFVLSLPLPPSFSICLSVSLSFSSFPSLCLYLPLSFCVGSVYPFLSLSLFVSASLSLSLQLCFPYRYNSVLDIDLEAEIKCHSSVSSTEHGAKDQEACIPFLTSVINVCDRQDEIKDVNVL